MPKCTTRGCNRPATWEIESRGAGAKYETPHLLITVYPDRRYLALTAEEIRLMPADMLPVYDALAEEAIHAAD